MSDIHVGSEIVIKKGVKEPYYSEGDKGTVIAKYYDKGWKVQFTEGTYSKSNDSCWLVEDAEAELIND